MTSSESGFEKDNFGMYVAAGAENLEVMSGARRYLSYVGSIVSEGLPPEGPILDFGTGNGVQTKYVNVAKSRLTCVEIDDKLRSNLAADGFSVAKGLDEFASTSFSGAFSMNCLEHITDDVSTLKELHRVLLPGAPLVMYVPAFPVLYTSMDARVGHVRRYRRRELLEKFNTSGFSVMQCRYVDSLGFLLTLTYRILRLRSGVPSPTAVKVFDNVVFPLSLVLDRVAKRLVGKNLFVIGYKS